MRINLTKSTLGLWLLALVGCAQSPSLNDTKLALDFGPCCQQYLFNAKISRAQEAAVYRQVALVRQHDSVNLVNLGPMARTLGQCQWRDKITHCQGSEQALTEQLLLATSLELSQAKAIYSNQALLISQKNGRYHLAFNTDTIELTLLEKQAL